MTNPFQGAACVVAFALSFAATVASAEPCPGDPEAVGTSRVMPVDFASAPRVGLKSFDATLPLAPREVILTFDDGPWPVTTSRVLDTLRAHCVRATFFLIGQNAAAHPGLARQIFAEGHSIGNHTFRHPILDRMKPDAAEADIDRGAAAIRAALGSAGPTPQPLWFRFPGFASTPALLDRLAARQVIVFGTDVWASDWIAMKPEVQLRLTMERLRAAGRGIILFHDTKKQTAAMLPAFLKALKQGGYRVVHIVPAADPAAAASGPLKAAP